MYLLQLLLSPVDKVLTARTSRPRPPKRTHSEAITTGGWLTGCATAGVPLVASCRRYPSLPRPLQVIEDRIVYHLLNKLIDPSIVVGRLVLVVVRSTTVPVVESTTSTTSTTSNNRCSTYICSGTSMTGSYSAWPVDWESSIELLNILSNLVS